MKRLIGILVFIIAIGLYFCLPALATSNVTGAKYVGTLRITNASTANSSVSTNFTLSTQNLINNLLSNSTCNNTAILTDGGIDTAYMPAAGTTKNWIVWIPSIGTSSILDYRLYAGGPASMNSKIRYFADTTGMTTPDNNASLEPGINYVLQLNGYFDATVTGNLTDKASAIDISENPAGTLTARIQGTGTVGLQFPIIETTSTGGNSTPTTALAVNLPTGYIANDMLIVNLSTFIDTVDCVITPPANWTQMYEKHWNAPGYWTTLASWYKLSTGAESSPVTWTSSVNVRYSYTTYRIRKNTFSGNVLVGTAATGTASNPDPPSVTSGFGAVDTLWLCPIQTYNHQTAPPTNYTNMLTAAGGDDSNCAQRSYTAASENPGTYNVSTDFWLANTIAIEGYGYASPSVNALTSGETVVTLRSDGANVWLQVGSSISANVTAVPIPNNANTWNFNKNYVMPFMGSANGTLQQIWINGSLRQTLIWQYATTFTDQSGNGNDGTPSFRTTRADADISAELVTFDAVSTAIANASASLPGTLVTAVPGQPPSMYTPSANVTFFFGPFISELLASLPVAIPPALFWLPFAFIITYFSGFFTYKFTKSITVKALVMGAFLMWFWLTNIYGGWVMIFYGCEAFGIVVLSRNYGW